MLTDPGLPFDRGTDLRVERVGEILHDEGDDLGPPLPEDASPVMAHETDAIDDAAHAQLGVAATPGSRLTTRETVLTDT